MRALGRLVLWLLLAAAVVVGLVWYFGPREAVGYGVAPDLPGPSALDDWLAEREAAFNDLRPGAEKRIRWAGRRGEVTPLSVVYVHGFSATSEEIRPVPDDLAARLGANLYFARLRGHGRDMQTGGAALAEATASDWMSDVREAAAIGAEIGERTVIVATSTGGTLVALAASEGLLPETVAGVALISPNFGVRARGARLLTLPGARWWLPLFAGRERSFAPQNEGHGDWWTARYPIGAAFPVGAATEAAARAEYVAATMPALFVFSPNDRVVDVSDTRAVAARWAGPSELVELHLPEEGADPQAHVVAGDILSPAMNNTVLNLLADWAEGL